VRAAWVFFCLVSTLDGDALHLLKRIFHYVHLGVVIE